MPKAIQVYEYGGPEVLRWEDVEVGAPGPGEVRIRQTAVGLNFIDVYHRSGLYKVPLLPFVPGLEGCGYIEELGEGVEEFSVGDRVAYGGGPMGAYAEARILPVSMLVEVPEPISDIQAAGIMVRGLTAHFLVKHTYGVGPMHKVLVHAAAGGVGLMLAQWAKAQGAMVIGTVSSEEKEQVAWRNGCDFVINYVKDDFVAKVREVTNGEGVHVVYDSVGKDTFMGSLDCLCRLGMMVSYGQSSGPVPPVDIGLLRDKGSLFLTRPSLMDYKKDRDVYYKSALELFDMILNHRLRINVKQTYYLSDAASAHRDLEARKTRGSTVLVV